MASEHVLPDPCDCIKTPGPIASRKNKDPSKTEADGVFVFYLHPEQWRLISYACFWGMCAFAYIQTQLYVKDYVAAGPADGKSCPPFDRVSQRCDENDFIIMRVSLFFITHSFLLQCTALHTEHSRQRSCSWKGLRLRRPESLGAILWIFEYLHQLGLLSIQGAYCHGLPCVRIHAPNLCCGVLRLDLPCSFEGWNLAMAFHFVKDNFAHQFFPLLSIP